MPMHSGAIQLSEHNAAVLYTTHSQCYSNAEAISAAQQGYDAVCVHCRRAVPVSARGRIGAVSSAIRCRMALSRSGPFPFFPFLTGFVGKGFGAAAADPADEGLGAAAKGPPDSAGRPAPADAGLRAVSKGPGAAAEGLGALAGRAAATDGSASNAAGCDAAAAAAAGGWTLGASAAAAAGDTACSGVIASARSAGALPSAVVDSDAGGL